MPAESHSEPGIVTGVSVCELVLVDESTEEPTSFLSDYSLPIGDQICDQTSAENSPSDEDDTLVNAEDNSREIDLEKMVNLLTNQRPHSDARYSWRRHYNPLHA